MGSAARRSIHLECLIVRVPEGIGEPGNRFIELYQRPERITDQAGRRNKTPMGPSVHTWDGSCRCATESETRLNETNERVTFFEFGAQLGLMWEMISVFIQSTDPSPSALLQSVWCEIHSVLRFV